MLETHNLGNQQGSHSDPSETIRRAPDIIGMKRWSKSTKEA